MRIVKHKGTKIHVGCGGIVLGRVCTKCGEEAPRKTIVDRVFGSEPIISREGTRKVDRREHRDRIREGKDLSK